MSDDERDILDALNEYGAAFKKRILQELGNTPGVTVLKEEYPVALAGIRSAIDIVAKLELNDRLCFLTLECKRALASFKKWVFFRETTTETFRIGRGFHKTTTISFGSHQKSLPNIVFCSDGCEIQKKPKGGCKANPDAIYKAATQASIASLGFLHERMPHFTSPPQLPKEPMVIVLPIIVTTAELAVCMTSPDRVDLSSGLLPELQVARVDWLAYRFPWHPGIATCETDFRVVDTMQNYIQTCMGFDQTGTDQYKETLYIVRSDRLSDFVIQHVPKVVEMAFDI